MYDWVDFAGIDHVGDQESLQKLSISNSITPFTTYNVHIVAQNAIGRSRVSKGDDIYRQRETYTLQPMGSTHNNSRDYPDRPGTKH